MSEVEEADWLAEAVGHLGWEGFLSAVASLLRSEAASAEGRPEWAALTAAQHKIEDAEAEVARLWRDES